MVNAPGFFVFGEFNLDGALSERLETWQTLANSLEYERSNDMTFKQRAQELLQSLPEELTAHDLEVEMAKLIQKLKIEEGLEASTNGQTVSHEEVTQRMARWL